MGGFLRDTFFRDDTPKRMLRDMPLIFLSVVGSSITSVIIATKTNLDLVSSIVLITISTFIVLMAGFLLYMLLFALVTED